MRYLLGIDFGGGASKATLLREDGVICADSTTEYPTYYQMPGCAEQNPADWVEATCRNISGVLEKSGVSPEEICAVSLDAATHTAVIMDGEFNVIRPAIYWTDTRSTGEVAFLKENYADVIDRQVLHKADTIWSLPELLWIKNNEPENWAKMKKILFAKDYVRKKKYRTLMFVWQDFPVRHFQWRVKEWDLMMIIKECVEERCFRMWFVFANIINQK